MQLEDLIKKLAEKSGISLNEIIGAEIEEEIATKMLTNLFSINEAKNDKSVKGHFFAQFSDGLDSQLNSFKEFGISEEKLSELKATEPSTFKRLNILVNEAKKLSENFANADGSKAKKIQEEYESKLNQILSEKESLSKTNLDLLNQFNNERTDWILEQKLSNHKISNAIPLEYRNEIAKKTINDYLINKDAKVVLENKQLRLKRISDETLDVLDFDLETAISKSLAEKNLLEVATQQAQTTAPTYSNTQNTNSTLSANIEKIKNLKIN